MGDLIGPVVVAPGPFKGALDAASAAAAIAAGLEDAGVVSRALPVADGGQGTLDALIAAVGGERRTMVVRDPLGRDVAADLGLLADGTAIVELAQASGWERLAEGERDPERTSTYGTGQLIGAALDAGAPEILLAVGGSATIDGGLGALVALGARIYDGAGAPLAGTGGELARVAVIDRSGLDPRLAETRLRIVADVTNPLCGPQGAAPVFGPQKGADAAAVARLDAGLAHLAEIIAREVGADVAGLPGAGAAGGVAAGLAGIAGATIEPGAAVVMEAIGLDAALAGSVLCITGEGALDDQTRQGKAPAAVAERCRRAGVPCVALCGALHLPPAALRAMGLAGAFAVGRAPRPLGEALATTTDDLTAAGAALGGLVRALVP